MDQEAALKELIQTVADLRSYHTGTVAALAWLVWDIVIMMDQEIKHVWLARWTPAKVLYISCRVFGLYILLLNTIEGTSANLPDRLQSHPCYSTPVPSPRPGLVRNLILYDRGIELLAISVNLIQILRVRALFPRRPLMILPLWCLFLANTGISIGLSVAVVSTATITPPPPLVTLYGCLTNVRRTQFMLGPYISSTFYSGVFFLVTLAKLYPYFRSKEGNTTVLTIFVRDGTVFFAVIFVVEIVSLVWGQIFTHYRPSLQDIVNQLRYAVYAIAGPRLILHLRGAVSQPSYATTAGLTTFYHAPTAVDSEQGRKEEEDSEEPRQLEDRTDPSEIRA